MALRFNDLASAVRFREPAATRTHRPFWMQQRLRSLVALGGQPLAVDALDRVVGAGLGINVELGAAPLSDFELSKLAADMPWPLVKSQPAVRKGRAAPL